MLQVAPRSKPQSKSVCREVCNCASGSLGSPRCGRRENLAPIASPVWREMKNENEVNNEFRRKDATSRVYSLQARGVTVNVDWKCVDLHSANLPWLHKCWRQGLKPWLPDLKYLVNEGMDPSHPREVVWSEGRVFWNAETRQRVGWNNKIRGTEDRVSCVRRTPKAGISVGGAASSLHPSPPLLAWQSVSQPG